MPSQAPAGERKRTAVLVVHGMGSQRPLETVRGVVNAVWRDKSEHQVWFHPELSGTDIDLTVQTTSYVPKADKRRVDFHELYWAHLIAETRAIAVLLWLFELAKLGPYLKRGMRPIWWGGAIYLVFLILSVSFLASEVVEHLAKVEKERVSMMLTPVITTAILATLCTIWALAYLSFRLSKWAAGLAIGSSVLLGVAWLFFRHRPEILEGFATHFLPATFALFVTLFLMGKGRYMPFVWAYLISFSFHFLKLWVFDGIGPVAQWNAVFHGGDPSKMLVQLIPWSLESKWSSTAAWLFISSYFVLSAAFLQPYIGDVARYLRNAPANVAGRRDIRRTSVDTLIALHESGKYDRIIVVAHSLGTVVAYDMLRATFARMFRDIPLDQARLNPEFDRIDKGDLKSIEWRRQARVLTRKIYELASEMRANAPPRPIGSPADEREPKAWLVTDFITLGCPLTHAHYLLCHGSKGPGPINDESELIKDFERRVKEREFPTCRPKTDDGDKVLTYTREGQLYYHHAAVFGLTRWTNIYFPLEQVFWGDAIGGPVALYDARDEKGQPRRAELFGRDIIDVAVSKLTSHGASFFTHTSYWSLDREKLRTENKPDPPHIQALKLAVNLADSDEAIDPKNFDGIEGVRVTS